MQLFFMKQTCALDVALQHVVRYVAKGRAAVSKWVWRRFKEPDAEGERMR